MSTGMCRVFCLGEWRSEERQQFHEGRAFVSQGMFQSTGYGDYLSISESHLRLIQRQDRNSPDDPNCFDLLCMLVAADLAARWHADRIYIRKWIVQRG